MKTSDAGRAASVDDPEFAARIREFGSGVNDDVAARLHDPIEGVAIDNEVPYHGNAFNVGGGRRASNT